MEEIYSIMKTINLFKGLMRLLRHNKNHCKKINSI